MAGLTPAEVFPPGEFIREELDERGWTQIEAKSPMQPVHQIEVRIEEDDDQQCGNEDDHNAARKSGCPCLDGIMQPISQPMP